MLNFIVSSLSKFYSKQPYRQEITAVIILKIAALWLIWSVCFSHIGNEKMTAHAMLNRMISSGEKHQG